jgi:fibronectin-binding autotransporter adhesin
MDLSQETFRPLRGAANRRFLIVVAVLICCRVGHAQTTTFWDGGSAGGNAAWSTESNWNPDGPLPNASDSNVVFNNRNGTGFISNLTVSGTRVLGLITFDNINSRLPATLEINTNGSGTTSRSLTLHTGITLQNTNTNVLFAGQNGTLSVVLGANNVFTTSAGSNLEFSSVVAISGGFRLTKQGAGTVTLGAANTFTGGMTISEGTLRIRSGLSLGANPSSYVAEQIIINGGTLDFSSASSFNSASNRGFSIGNSGGTISVSDVGVYTISAVIADLSGEVGTLTKTGTGTLVMGGVNTFTGGTVINEGTLRISQSTGLGAAPESVTANHVTLNGGTLEFSSTGDTTLTANRGFSVGDSGGAIQVSSTGGLTLSGIVADVGGQSGMLTKTGTGRLTLTPGSANTYSGGTLVASGTLRYGRTGSLGTGAVQLGSAGGGNATLENHFGGWTTSNDITVAAGSGGTLTLAYTSAASFSGIFEGGITLNDHLTLRSEAVEGFAMRIIGTISGAHDLTKTGAGVVRIEANNTGYSGTTTISNGTLQLGSFAGSANGTLGTGEIINDATLRINRSNAFALSNLISGTGVVTQTGTGTTTLSNANTYTGGTTLSAGILLATNTTGSATGTGALTTAIGTTLGGTGTISPAGANSVIIGGAVAPGVAGAAGTLTFTPVDGNVTFQNGGSMAFELFGNGDNDKIAFNSAGSGVIDLSALPTGSLGVTFGGGYTADLGHSFDLLDWAALTGPGVGGLSASLLDLSAAVLAPSLTWDTSLFASAGVITVVLVPEPSRLILVLAGLVGVVWRRRTYAAL